MSETSFTEHQRTLLHLLRLAGSSERVGFDFEVNLTRLDLSGRECADTDLEWLGQFSKLEVLRLRGCRAVTDAGLLHLARLAGLRWLDLGDTGVADAGLGQLAGLMNLRRLDLSGLPVTDAGVRGLERLAQLRTLVLAGDRVSKGGRDRLAAAIPGLRITARSPDEEHSSDLYDADEKLDVEVCPDCGPTELIAACDGGAYLLLCGKCHQEIICTSWCAIGPDWEGEAVVYYLGGDRETLVRGKVSDKWQEIAALADPGHLVVIEPVLAEQAAPPDRGGV